MKTSPLKTVGTARTAIEADLILGRLRAAGLHPVDLRMFGHFTLAGADIDFPIQVPSNEARVAGEILRSWRSDETV